MAALKAIPKKRSGRLLVVVRNVLYKQMIFEAWLSVNHTEYFEEDRLNMLRRKVAKLDIRIQRAVSKERIKETQTAFI